MPMFLIQRRLFLRPVFPKRMARFAARDIVVSLVSKPLLLLRSYALLHANRLARLTGITHWMYSRVTGHVALSSCCAWFLAPGATGGPRLLFNRIGDVMRFRASAHESPARLNPMTSRFRLNPIAATTISGSINQEY